MSILLHDSGSARCGCIDNRRGREYKEAGIEQYVCKLRRIRRDAAKPGIFGQRAGFRPRWKEKRRGKSKEQEDTWRR